MVLVLPAPRNPPIMMKRMLGIVILQYARVLRAVNQEPQRARRAQRGRIYLCARRPTHLQFLRTARRLWASSNLNRRQRRQRSTREEGLEGSVFVSFVIFCSKYLAVGYAALGSWWLLTVVNQDGADAKRLGVLGPNGQRF